MTLAAKPMAMKNCLVKKLEAVKHLDLLRQFVLIRPVLLIFLRYA